MKTYIIIPLICLLILLGFILFFRNNGTEPGDITACTMEALICPDGSAVGRSGPSCEFAACPHQDEFVGVLVPSEEGFMLRITPPEGAGGLDWYNIPLAIRASNASRDLVNEQVRVSGEFDVGNLLQAETIEEVPDGDAQIPVGTAKTIGGLRIAFNKMVQDSRCPIDVQCIEAGAVTVNVTFDGNGEKMTANMASDEVPYEFAGFKISILDVIPPRLSGEEPHPESYMVKFKVE